MVKNDYLSFNSLSDLKNYAERHKVFDSNVVSEFQNDYLSQLANEGFNEQYYLNKKYSDKTMLELLEERANYLRGIEKLRDEGKISRYRARIERRRILEVAKKEDEERKRIEYANSNKFFGKNISMPTIYENCINIKLNRNALYSVVREKTDFNKLLPNYHDSYGIYSLNYTESCISKERFRERKERSRKDELDAEIFMNKDYVTKLSTCKKYVEESIIENKGELKNNLPSYYTKSEQCQLDTLKNEKKYMLQKLEKKLKSAWFKKTKNYYKAAIEDAETYYDDEEAKLNKQFTENRIVVYNKVKEYDNDYLTNYQKIEISKISPNIQKKEVTSEESAQKQCEKELNKPRVLSHSTIIVAQNVINASTKNDGQSIQ